MKQKIIYIASFLSLSSFVTSFLMVLGSVKPSYPLCFLVFSATVAGLLLGLLGFAYRCTEI